MPGQLHSCLPRLMRLAFALIALGAGAALVACGEDPTERDIEQTIVDYGAANGSEACGFLSASALDQLGGESGCTRKFENVPAVQLTVEEVMVEGDGATALARNAQSDQPIDLQLALESGDWKISGFPGLNLAAEPGGGEEAEQGSGRGSEEDPLTGDELDEQFEGGAE